MKFQKTLLSVSALVALVGFGLLGGTASAAVPNQRQAPGTAANTTPRPVRILGRVDSVSSSGLVLQTRLGSVTVNVAANTWIVVPGSGRCVEGALSDIQTGRPAEVAGMTTTTATGKAIDARVITQGRCMGPLAGKEAARDLLAHLAAGTVKSINGSTITLAAVKGDREITVNTTADTVVMNNGFQSVSTIKVGDKIGVLGRPDKAAGTPPPTAPGNGTRTITAWGIHVESAATKIMLGHVDSVNGNTVILRTLKNKDGVTVTLDSKTAYKALTIVDQKATLTNATAADVKVNSNLIVEGATSNADKSLTARSVIIMPGAKNKPAKP